MRRFLKINLVGSSFWQLDNNNSYTKRNYEPKDELLDNVFFEVLPSGIFKEITTGNALIIKNDNNVSVDYPRGVDIPISCFKKTSSLEIRTNLTKIKELNLENEYKIILDELLIKSQQCELVCEKKKTMEL